MLRVLRDNLKYLSWILWVVILVFIAFVFVDFGGGLASSRVATSAAATVGDRRVSYQEFEREYRRLEEQYRQAFGGRLPPEMVDQLRLPAQALERLVDRKLLAAEARERGLSANDEEVQRAILAIPGVQDDKGNFVGPETYEGFLRQNGYTARDFEELVREDLAISKLTRAVAAGVAISDAEVERAWREANERAAVRYLLVPASRHAAQATLSPEQVRAYFEAHRAEFKVPDQRIVDYLLVDAARLRATIDLPAAEIERYYAEHPQEFTRPEEVRARHVLVKIDESRDEAEAERRMAEVRARLARGESFETVAAALSDDPGSKDRGGDLGYFGRGQMIAAFEQAAFDGAVGAIVGPVRTSFGLHLIEILDHRSGGVQPLEQATAAIRSRLAGERAASEAESRARELARRIAEEKLTTEAEWRALADDDVVTYVTTPAFGREDSVAGIGRNAEFAAAAFALAPGAVSPPVRTPRGWAVLGLREERPAHDAELAEVEAAVRTAAQQAEALRLAEAELARARGALAAGRTLDEAATELGLTVQESGEFTATGSIPGLGAARPVADAAFALAPGQVGGPLRVGAGAVLFEVVSRTGFDATAFAAARETTRAELRQAEAGKLIAALIAARKKEVGVSYDRPLLEQFGLIETQAG
jgi:peptidyl-prolyl cis-trans isomerase D